MPWSPTTAFPHPLAASRSDAQPGLTNFLSYPLVDNVYVRQARIANM
jgi:hypothetical protein